jgi:hypothetical protein
MYRLFDGAIMAKIVIEPLKAPKSNRRPTSVSAKRVKGEDGKSVTFHTVSAESRTFEHDLSYVFRQNVKRARRANKQLTGSPNHGYGKR